MGVGVAMALMLSEPACTDRLLPTKARVVPLTFAVG